MSVCDVSVLWLNAYTRIQLFFNYHGGQLHCVRRQSTIRIDPLTEMESYHGAGVGFRTCSDLAAPRLAIAAGAEML